MYGFAYGATVILAPVRISLYNAIEAGRRAKGKPAEFTTGFAGKAWKQTHKTEEVLL